MGERQAGEAVVECKAGALSMAGLLLGIPAHYPPPGVARIHRLADEEGVLPERYERLNRYIEVIRSGASTEEGIRVRLPFEATARQVKEDLRDLVRRGVVRVMTRRGTARYFLAEGEFE